MNIEEFSKRNLLLLPIFFLSFVSSCAYDSIRIENIEMKKEGKDKIKILLFTNKSLDKLKGIQKSNISLNYVINSNNSNINVNKLKRYNTIWFYKSDNDNKNYNLPHPKFIEKSNGSWKYELFIPSTYGKGIWVPRSFVNYNNIKHAEFGQVTIGQEYDLRKGKHKVLFWMSGPNAWGIQTLDSNKYIYKYEAK